MEIENVRVILIEWTDPGRERLFTSDDKSETVLLETEHWIQFLELCPMPGNYSLLASVAIEYQTEVPINFQLLRKQSCHIKYQTFKEHDFLL
ncbi:hypothetical protein KGQ72_01730 [Patescibacteria group bacterium]|nr:hypothetical protein [Patescibacteria group bacterium]